MNGVERLRRPGGSSRRRRPVLLLWDQMSVPFEPELIIEARIVVDETLVTSSPKEVAVETSTTLESESRSVEPINRQAYGLPAARGIGANGDMVQCATCGTHIYRISRLVGFLRCG